jgi:elongation factor Ts
MVKRILDIAMAEKPADLEALKALKAGDLTVEQLVTERSGVTGEKMELSDYAFIKAPLVDAYNHLGNKLSALTAADNAAANHEVLHGISMQVASMSPIALDAEHVAQEVKDRELAVAVDKTKQDEINKAVENALRKAGLNPAHADSDDHIESNMAKGWLTAEQAQIARDIRAKVPAEAEAQINLKKVEMIAQGRLQKFLKESTLVEQQYILSESKELVKDVLKKENVNVIDFKRITLNQE